MATFMERGKASLAITGLITLLVIGGGFYIYREFTKGRDERTHTNIVQKAESLCDKDFPEEKILTVSAESYVKSKGKNLGDYDMIGVSGASEKSERIYIGLTVPRCAEVVVDYKPKGSCDGIGTALIPKDKITKEHRRGINISGQ